jgi:hypothetical protein
MTEQDEYDSHVAALDKESRRQERQTLVRLCVLTVVFIL